MRDLAGCRVRLRIVDRSTGSWGHINVDHIVQTDRPPPRFDIEHRLERYRHTPRYMNEPLRPQFHFSPEINWMNDPNGLVFHDGEYHLFYQYNPAGNSWGHMSWGHAVSRDLTKWQHLPLAIPETEGEMAFSGCCVVDHANTSGFSADDRPPLVAVYTGHRPGRQVQNLAFSNDQGRTWTRFSGNPVLDIASADFRDPKCSGIKALSAGSCWCHWRLKNRCSSTRRRISKTGRNSAVSGPQAFETNRIGSVPICSNSRLKGLTGRRCGSSKPTWEVALLAGGSGGEYFVGHFDGFRFTTTQHAQWVDYCRDFYAPVSWSDIPNSDGRRIWIGWFNNWQTCLIPTSPWRSCMSVPRSLSLREVSFNDEEPPTWVMVQQPVRELEQLRGPALIPDTADAGWPPRAVTTEEALEDGSFELQTRLHPGGARSVGFRIRTGSDEFTEIGYDRHHLSVYVDRMQSGHVDFHEEFGGRHEAPARNDRWFHLPAGAVGSFHR